MNRQRFTKPYMLLVIAIGAVVSVYSAIHLPIERIDLRFLVLALLTISISSRLSVRIPRISGHISVSDTFIFLTMLIYGGEAAILLAAAEALCSTLRFSKKAIYIKPLTIIFNTAMMACSTFLTVLVLRSIFGSIIELRHGEFSGTFVAALCVMALVQYVTNSSLAALHTSFKTNQSSWHTWSKYYLWASITYFAGASAAGITAKITDIAGFYALVATTPIIAIVYFTYRTYLQNIDAMAEAAKAEAAAEAKAEALAAQAEQARRHVEELNHYIAEQERIREQYSQIEKMSALGELASGVAHDFNNTLAGILGRAQLLLGKKDPAKIENGLKIIIKTAKDGAKTIKRIQDFARQRRDHDFQPVDMSQLLLDVGEITRPRWKNRAEAANVHINLNLQLRCNALIMGDESELREVLVNIVFNAVDAMPQGGTLTLSAQGVDGFVDISVSDTGIGMSEEVRQRIFDPFFTTKGKTGMGLGLAVSYGIVRRHEGIIEVESEVGRGTSFRIRLPIAKGAVKARPTAELPAIAKPQLAQTRILVVDDEEYVRDLLRDILEAEGCEVALAEGGREALTLFEAGKFDAIFTDVGMPEMSGWELARAVRERNTNIPLAVITGWGEAVGSSERKAAQVDWVVAKPFDTPQIVEIAQEVFRRREGNSEGVDAIVAA
jgi:signal transduction histidine kinase/ActR/RegA family two-component response regulator